MKSSFAAIAALLAAAPNVMAVPADNTFRLTLSAADAFPHALGDITPYEVDAEYVGYNASTISWLQSLDLSSATTDDEKARILTSASYARPYDETDSDMTSDHDALLSAVSGQSPVRRGELIERATNRFVTSASHAVIWHTCAATFSCLTGLTCKFSITPGKAPRSKCQSVGGQNCCVSWSDYSVKAGFFSTTWTNCNEAVNDEHMTKASCEGYGETKGGDVCLSNRATGCT